MDGYFSAIERPLMAPLHTPNSVAGNFVPTCSLKWHANTGIPFRPSIRTGSGPANVARPRNHMREIRMKLTEDPATRVVALKIIELAQRGVRDAPTLTEITLQELKHYLPYV